jgi:hypothetical protein
VPSYPAGITVSNHALITVSDALRHRRAVVGTRWRRLSADQQALLVLAHLRKGETYADLAVGFRDRHDHGVPLHPRSPRCPDCAGTDVAPRRVRRSPALPGARHDMGAAREHGILEALHDAGICVTADSAYGGSRFRSDDDTATLPSPDVSGCHTTSVRSTPHPPAYAVRANERTPSSRPGRSSARPASAHTAPPNSSKPSWSSSTPADAKWKMLTVVDEFTREAPAMVAARSFTADDTTTLLDKIIVETRPAHLRMDNGPELTAAMMRDWVGGRGSGAAPGSCCRVRWARCVQRDLNLVIQSALR